MKKITAVLVIAFSLGSFSHSCSPGPEAILFPATSTDYVPSTPTATPLPSSRTDMPALVIPLMNTASPTQERFHLVSATFDPANLTPSVKSQRLADAMTAMSAALACQNDSGPLVAKAYASEATLGCTQTTAGNQYSVFLDFRLGGFPSGSECFHGYLASSNESAYPVQEMNANHEVTKSYFTKGRSFLWFAQGIEYWVDERIDGQKDSELPPPGLPDKIYAELIRLGIITSDGSDCTP